MALFMVSRQIAEVLESFWPELDLQTSGTRWGRLLPLSDGQVLVHSCVRFIATWLLLKHSPHDPWAHLSAWGMDQKYRSVTTWRKKKETLLKPPQTQPVLVFAKESLRSTAGKDESLRSTAGKDDHTYASQITYRKHLSADWHPSSVPEKTHRALQSTVETREPWPCSNRTGKEAPCQKIASEAFGEKDVHGNPCAQTSCEHSRNKNNKHK